MSDEKKNIGVEIKVPEFVEDAGRNLLGPATKGIGQTMGDIWYFVFGGVSHWAEKKRIERERALVVFRTGLEQKLYAIPEDKRIEPNTQILMNSLDDAQYCLEEPELRVLLA